MSQQAPYSYVNLGTARQELANRLFDSQTFWAPAELTLYIQESLRTWNALTNFWRNDFLFSIASTLPLNQWIDLTNPTLLPTSPRPYTLTDVSLYTVIEYHLLEPPTGATWTGSLQFTADDLINSVARRRDALLSATSCTQTRHLVPAVAGRVTLPDIVLDVRRIAYLPTQAFDPGLGYGSGLYGFGLYGVSDPPYIALQQPVTLFAEDQWAWQSFNSQVPLLPAGTPTLPSTYVLTTDPPLSFDVDAPPSFAGSYEVLTVDAGLTLSAAGPSTMSVPDDWLWVIKWGALADLLSRDSNARDPLRAQYAEQRFRMGLALLEQASALLAVKINGVPVQVDAIRAADLFNVTWETTVAGPPMHVYHSGLNLVAFSPTPDAGIGTPPQPYSITATVVENAPVPITDTDLIQMSRGDYDAILDYAQHLASFKQGGAEFLATTQHLERFLKQCALANRKLNQIGEFQEFLFGLSRLEKESNPVQVPEAQEAK